MTRQARILLSLAAIALVAVLGALAATSLLGSTTSSTNGVAAADGPPFTVPTGDAAVITNSSITVDASSYLEPDGDISYSPDNLVDGDLQTAWNSNSREDEGQGQTLTFRFSEPVDLRAVRFVNGYAKNDVVYGANHRVRKLLVLTDDSEALQPVTLLDTSERQEVSHNFGLTSKVVLEIIEIYPGEGFQNPDLTSDLALTEVTFIAIQPDS